jgi:hypothetical protein
MKTLFTVVGMASWSSLVILIADSVWLLHDIANNGISVPYVLITLFFIIGYTGLAYSLHKHEKAINKKRANLYYTDDSSHCGD